MGLWQYLLYLAHFITVGNFVIIDLIAITTNALNGALLVQRPDYYRSNQWSIVGILIMAILGGIGGGVARDLLLNKVPNALTNPWYLILCLAAGALSMLISYKGGQQFHEGLYQLLASFSLPWYAAIGVNAALSANLPDIAAIAIGVIGSTAGVYLIDITAGHPAKLFVRSEWLVGTAVLVSIVFLICEKYFGLSIWPATLISFTVGFIFRLLALWYAWEEPLPKLPHDVMGEVAQRGSLKEKLRPGWKPKYD